MPSQGTNSTITTISGVPSYCSSCGNLVYGPHHSDECIQNLKEQNEDLITRYNFLEMQRKYEAKHYVALEEMDRELFFLFNEYGPSCVEAVQGMRLLQMALRAEQQKNVQIEAACKATCAAIEFRGKSSMATYGELAEDESNWRDGVEPYLLDLYNQVRVAIGDVDTIAFHLPVTPEQCACGRDLVCPIQYEENKRLEEK